MESKNGQVATERDNALAELQKVRDELTKATAEKDMWRMRAEVKENREQRSLTVASGSGYTNLMIQGEFNH